MKAQEKIYGNVNEAKFAALKDIKGEINVSKSNKKHWRYKRSGFTPFKDGEFNLDDAPYFYNTLLGFTV